MTCYFRVEKTQEALDSLISGKVDAAIVACPLPKNKINTQIKDIPIYFEPFYLCCNKYNHFSNQETKDITIPEIKNHKIIIKY